MEPVVCEGAPRDQGLDQGFACAAAIRDRIARAGLVGRRRIPSLKPLAHGPVLGRGTGRELVRHYPHLVERMQGIARGANLSFASLIEAFCRDGGLESGASVVVGVTTSGAKPGDAHATLALCKSPLAAMPAASWIARRSRPEVGYASLELTLPWLGTALAGVNEAGIAAAFAAPTTPALADPGGGLPPVVLVQECLQRFADLEACVEWCVKRPTSGHGSILLSDAAGRLAGLRFEGASPRAVRAKDGLLVEGGSPALRAAIRDAWKTKPTRTAGSLLMPCAVRNGDALASLEPAGRELQCPEPGRALVFKL